jgi:hypothetical protein
MVQSHGCVLRAGWLACAAGLGVVLFSASAGGQCSPEWRAGPGANGFNAEAWAMTHWDPDGAGPRQPLLIVGGTFTTAGGQPANRIASWDGAEWHALGAGVNGSVRTLAVDPTTGNLLVGGDFTLAGGAAAFYAARWNGSAWSPLGGGVNNIVTGLHALPSGQVFVAGAFTVVGGNVASVRSAIWTGTAWQALAAGAAADSFVVTSTGDVYAGGNFNTSVDPNVRRWTGPGAGAWSSVGGGLGGCFGGESVTDMAQLSNGDVLCIGDFASARPGCTQMRFASRWNGTAWTEMYSPSLASPPYALAVLPGDDIYVGTNWTNIWPGAGCTAMRWNPATSAWDSMGAYFDSGGNPFFVDIEVAPDGAMYFCGRIQFMTVNGGQSWSPVGHIVRYGAPTPIIAGHPSDTLACPGVPVVLSVTSSGPGTLTYQWRRNGVALSDEPNHISGSGTATLTILNLQPGDLGVYACAVTNSCGTAMSRDATIGQSACDCIDFNLDGLFPDTQDIADFLSVFAGGVCAGQQATDPPCNIDIDYNNDGLFPDTLDIESLLSTFAGGACL